MFFTPAFIFLQENPIYHKTGKKQPISRVSPFFSQPALSFVEVSDSRILFCGGMQRKSEI